MSAIHVPSLRTNSAGCAHHESRNNSARRKGWLFPTRYLKSPHAKPLAWRGRSRLSCSGTPGLMQWTGTRIPSSPRASGGTLPVTQYARLYESKIMAAGPLPASGCWTGSSQCCPKCRAAKASDLQHTFLHLAEPYAYTALKHRRLRGCAALNGSSAQPWVSADIGVSAARPSGPTNSQGRFLPSPEPSHVVTTFESSQS